MEQRSGNMIIQASGGTAAKDSKTYKVALPSAWVRAMGITAFDRQIELRFDGTAITIAKRQTLQEFIEDGRASGHELILLRYYNGETLCSEIAADPARKMLCVANHTSNVIRTAFGNNLTPTWDELQTFLEERCIPRTRAGLREYLETIGVDRYEPLEIIKKTGGRMAEDEQWLQVEVIR